MSTLSIAEAAARMGISASGVRRLIAAGSLRSIRLSGRRVGIEAADLEAYVAACTVLVTVPVAVPVAPLPPRRPTAAVIDSTVYIIDEGDDEGPVKIGVTGVGQTAVVRLATLQTGNPRKLRIVHVGPGDYGVESYVHFLLAEWRLCGEWFSRSDTVKAFIVAARASGYYVAIDLIANMRR